MKVPRVRRLLNLRQSRKQQPDSGRSWMKDQWQVTYSAIGYNVPIAMHYPDGVTSPSS